MTTLSSLLSSIRSAGPSLPLLRQIPQPILIEWARGEFAGAGGIMLLVGPRISQVLVAQTEILSIKRSAWPHARWMHQPCADIHGHIFGTTDDYPAERGWICSLPLHGSCLARLFSFCESRLSILSILRVRQASLESRPVVREWQGETEDRLVEGEE